MIPPILLQLYFVIKIDIPDRMPVINTYNADPVSPDVRDHINRGIPGNNPEHIAVTEVFFSETYVEFYGQPVAERESSILIQAKGSPVFRNERVGFEGKPIGNAAVGCCMGRQCTCRQEQRNEQSSYY